MMSSDVMTYLTFHRELIRVACQDSWEKRDSGNGDGRERPVRRRNSAGALHDSVLRHVIAADVSGQNTSEYGLLYGRGQKATYLNTRECVVALPA